MRSLFAQEKKMFGLQLKVLIMLFLTSLTPMPEFTDSTVTQSSYVIADVAEDSRNNIYVSGGIGGSTVYRISPSGESLFVSGLSGATGLEIGPRDHLFVAEYWNSRIHEYSPSGNLVNTFETPFFGPTGLKFGSGHRLYVTEFGNLDSELRGDGSAIYRLDTRGGEFTQVVSDPRILGPVDIEFGPFGNLIISSGHSGKLYRYDRLGNLTVAADAGKAGIDSLGWFATLGPRFYATSFQTGEVVSMDMAGGSETISAGAPFEGPNGIAAGFEGDSLLVVETVIGTLTRLTGGSGNETALPVQGSSGHSTH